MHSLVIQILIATAALVSSLPEMAVAEPCPIALVRPACGKICKLVCETKKLTAIGYGSECKDICLPPPSRPGCKRSAVACGEEKWDPKTTCPSAAPKCEFSWRDWFACGCSRPRSIKVLTKYQAEKEICWYHWEVVDAASCDCASLQLPVDSDLGIVQSAHSRDLYKAAPGEAEVGDSLPISAEEWGKLARYVQPNAAALQDTPRETKTTSHH